MTPPSFVKPQQGSVLIMALVLLLIMTLTGVGSMSDNILQERMAGSQYDRNAAFQTAEANLRQTELVIRNSVVPLKALAEYSNCTSCTASNGTSLPSDTQLTRLPALNALPLYEEGTDARLAQVGGDSLETGTANSDSFQVRVVTEADGDRRLTRLQEEAEQNFSDTTVRLNTHYLFYIPET